MMQEGASAKAHILPIHSNALKTDQNFFVDRIPLITSRIDPIAGTKSEEEDSDPKANSCSGSGSSLSSSSDESQPSQDSKLQLSPDIRSKFPPPNPLPPQLTNPENEPLRIGGNISFLYCPEIANELGS